MKTLYQCDVCGRSSADEASIRACETRGIEKHSAIEVGDIVTARAGFGWFDGDPRWIANWERHKRGLRRTTSHGNCFGKCCTYQFLYVVTAIDTQPEDGHRVRYHLATKAMTKKTGYHSGYTFDDGGHCTPRVLLPKQKLDTDELIGHKAEGLL